ncbi:MAG TPA: cupin domain-containing protein [Usitatibacter sp.]|nr:cupin domain-containing protein [Usitatibacter sp.]
MATQHAESGEIIPLFPAPQGGERPGSVALIRDQHFEVFRLVMEVGKELPVHEVPSLITIQCLRGRVEVIAHGRPRALPAGHLMYLAGGEPHGVKALEESSILVTMLVGRE